MGLRVVQLGSPRAKGEGLRIGTVRRPPRGVKKSEYASGDWYDVWFPNLAPSAVLLKEGRAALTDAQWRAFSRHYMAEMANSENRHSIELLAALSRDTDFSIGCYCKDEKRCHRSLLKKLLERAGAQVHDD